MNEKTAWYLGYREKTAFRWPWQEEEPSGAIPMALSGGAIGSQAAGWTGALKERALAKQLEELEGYQSTARQALGGADTANEATEALIGKLKGYPRTQDALSDLLENALTSRQGAAGAVEQIGEMMDATRGKQKAMRTLADAGIYSSLPLALAGAGLGTYHLLKDD
jgi:hypothetical protein